MSHYNREGLFLRVRANCDVPETIELRWSAEVATQWTDYEFLQGTIEIPIGENVGKLDIPQDKLGQYRRTRSLSQSNQVKTKKLDDKEGFVRFNKVHEIVKSSNIAFNIIYSFYA